MADLSFPGRTMGVAAWLGLACYVAAVVGFAWRPTQIAQALTAVGIAVSFCHAGLSYGWRHASALFVICVTVTVAVENVGVATGLPFGRYHFEVGKELPHIGTIPIVVGPLWFGMGYLSWQVAATLLGRADRHLDLLQSRMALPIVAAFVMTQWDLVMDPPSATIGKAWIWHDGGAHFGVPLSNYFGWFVTSWLFYQVFALYLGRQASRTLLETRGGLRAAAILLYAGAGLTHLTPWLLGDGGEVTDAAGHVWRVADVRESAVALMVFTMLFTSVLAALRLLQTAPAAQRSEGGALLQRFPI